MPHRFAEIAFTDSVKQEQIRMGAQRIYDRLMDGPDRNAELSDQEAGFIAARDSFYLSTVSESGWPYVQHRGGPPGFVRILDSKTIGFADFRGNRQYLTLGNLKAQDKVCLFFMDYPRQTRLKLLGTAEVRETPAGIADFALPDSKVPVERAIVIHVAGFDWNCPQHITPRFTQGDVARAVAPLHQRIADLEAEVERLNGGYSAARLPDSIEGAGK